MTTDTIEYTVKILGIDNLKKKKKKFCRELNNHHSVFLPKVSQTLTVKLHFMFESMEN